MSYSESGTNWDDNELPVTWDDANSRGSAGQRDWLQQAMDPGSRVQNAYHHGLRNFASDLNQLLPAFDEVLVEAKKRTYHRLMHLCFDLHEYRAARDLAEKLHELGEGWWLCWRHFTMWRLGVATIGGSVALGGCQAWTDVLKELAKWNGPAVAVTAIALTVVPGLVSEYLQSPPPALWRKNEFWFRVRLVTFWAVFYAAILSVSAALLGRVDFWKEADWRLDVLMASVSTMLGYAINLIWRDRPILGP